MSDDSVEYNHRTPGPTPRVSTVSCKSTSSIKSNVSMKSIQEHELESMSEWKDLFVHVVPFDLSEWSESSLISKLFIVWKSPIYFLLLSTVPVVDAESYRANWCRLLNCFHLMSAPLMMIILTGNYGYMIGGRVPLIAIIAAIGFGAGALTYYITNFHEPPKFHSMFAYIGFFASVCWIYFLANEVIDLLQAVGILFGLSDVILGLTVLAWGNSLGDLISNISMAKQGFPRMAISACYGGPLLSKFLWTPKLKIVKISSSRLTFGNRTSIHVSFDRDVGTLFNCKISLLMVTTGFYNYINFAVGVFKDDNVAIFDAHDWIDNDTFIPLLEWVPDAQKIGNPSNHNLCDIFNNCNSL